MDDFNNLLAMAHGSWHLCTSLVRLLGQCNDCDNFVFNDSWHRGTVFALLCCKFLAQVMSHQSCMGSLTRHGMVFSLLVIAVALK